MDLGSAEVELKQAVLSGTSERSVEDSGAAPPSPVVPAKACLTSSADAAKSSVPSKPSGKRLAADYRQLV